MNGCGFEALYHLMGAFHVITFCSCTAVQTKELLENYLPRKVKGNFLFGCYVRHLGCLNLLNWNSNIENGNNSHCWPESSIELK
jgi:hypothetical protein